MNKAMYFFIGYMTAIITIFMASCTISPLEAGSGELGSTEWNPVYVKIVD